MGLHGQFAAVVRIMSSKSTHSLPATLTHTSAMTSSQNNATADTQTELMDLTAFFGHLRRLPLGVTAHDAL